MKIIIIIIVIIKGDTFHTILSRMEKKSTLVVAIIDEYSIFCLAVGKDQFFFFFVVVLKYRLFISSIIHFNSNQCIDCSSIFFVDPIKLNKQIISTQTKHEKENEKMQIFIWYVKHRIYMLLPIRIWYHKIYILTIFYSYSLFLA